MQRSNEQTTTGRHSRRARALVGSSGVSRALPLRAVDPARGRRLAGVRADVHRAGIHAHSWVHHRGSPASPAWYVAVLAAASRTWPSALRVSSAVSIPTEQSQLFELAVAWLGAVAFEAARSAVSGDPGLLGAPLCGLRRALRSRGAALACTAAPRASSTTASSSKGTGLGRACSARFRRTRCTRSRASIACGCSSSSSRRSRYCRARAASTARWCGASPGARSRPSQSGPPRLRRLAPARALQPVAPVPRRRLPAPAVDFRQPRLVRLLRGLRTALRAARMERGAPRRPPPARGADPALFPGASSFPARGPRGSPGSCSWRGSSS